MLFQGHRNYLLDVNRLEKYGGAPWWGQLSSCLLAYVVFYFEEFQIEDDARGRELLYSQVEAWRRMLCLYYEPGEVQVKWENKGYYVPRTFRER